MSGIYQYGVDEEKGRLFRLLLRQYDTLREEILEEMNRIYPPGAEVVFWRNSKQVNPSHGIICYNTVRKGLQIRVRYVNSNHAVSLYPDISEFRVCQLSKNAVEI